MDNDNQKDSIEKEVDDPGIYVLIGEITTKSVEECINWVLGMNEIDNPPQVMTMYICSEGGDLHAAQALIEIMKISKIPISTIAIGQICSAGLFIFVSGTRGMRVLTDSCSIMSHNFSTEVGGNYSTLEAATKELRLTHRRVLKIFLDNSNLDEKEIVERLIGPFDYYLTPEEAIAMGLADRIM